MKGQPIEPGGSLVLPSLRLILMYTDEIKYEKMTSKTGRKMEQLSISFS